MCEDICNSCNITKKSSQQEPWPAVHEQNEPRIVFPSSNKSLSMEEDINPICLHITFQVHNCLFLVLHHLVFRSKSANTIWIAVIHQSSCTLEPEPIIEWTKIKANVSTMRVSINCPSKSIPDLLVRPRCSSSPFHLIVLSTFYICGSYLLSCSMPWPLTSCPTPLWKSATHSESMSTQRQRTIWYHH